MIRQKYREEFEQIGVDDLRKRVAASTFDAEKLQYAREWLDEKEHGEQRQSTREQIEIAREAKDAAWAAARAAQSANTRATIALIIAAISAVCAIVAIILPHFWKSP